MAEEKQCNKCEDCRMPMCKPEDVCKCDDKKCVHCCECDKKEVEKK